MGDLKFQLKTFADCDLNDSFFDSLKADYGYEDFSKWFQGKAEKKKPVYVCLDEHGGTKAFLYLKDDECEKITLKDRELSAVSRIKIGTLKLSDDVQGQRLGEGAIGLALWHWQQQSCDEIYVTVFDSHKDLTDLLLKFGFEKVGYKNDTGEGVYVKAKSNLDRSNGYTMFPYLNKDKLEYTRMLPIYPKYHDTLFSYSKLERTKQEGENIAAANGITKVYIATSAELQQYDVGKPVMIYRIADDDKMFKSVITSFCTIVGVDSVKQNGQENMSLQEFISKAGNKTVFNYRQLEGLFRQENVVLLTLVYNGFFGTGNNVNLKTLVDCKWWDFNRHLYSYEYTPETFKKILRLGNVDPDNVIR